MAANAWALYVGYQTFAVNIYKSITTKIHHDCEFDVDTAHDLSTYKLWCLVATLSFLIPLILVMFR